MKCTGKRYFYIEKKEIEYKIDYITKSKEKLKKQFNLNDEDILKILESLQIKLEKINKKISKM
ncbi:hypothetical protein BGT96_15910 [Clostridioides difficile]|uniref:hypothetical protein n=1 Tax=Clostridioides TaxID=1870884 RepID=UPI00038D1E0A|nr:MULTISPECIES: hypothetical protein [Clostridioides]MCC0664979.1 hypothetical protein [Clostridioides sp. ZZV15-6597]MCC0784492.1 hypothetical protein [Clostridioides sp. ES-S-0108-01]EGT3953447.1 hypothetical protein [Clostridioides difficile]EJX3465482.1 hypothetical protein [Clostridioides difficile]EQJ94790.1 hypothetical protein QUA_0945 [Clostridioides difficile P49]